MIELFYVPNPIAQAVAILLEEGGLEYQGYYPENMADFPEDLRFEDRNRIPPLLLDDKDFLSGRPVEIIHPGAAMVYLAAKAKFQNPEVAQEFFPTDQNANIAAEQWVMWQAASQTFRPSDAEPEDLGRRQNFLFALVNTWLSGREFLAGNRCSIADMMCFPWVKHWLGEGTHAYGHENLNRWLASIGHRRAVRAGMQKGAEQRDVHSVRLDALARALKYSYAAGDPTTPWGRPPLRRS